MARVWTQDISVQVLTDIHVGTATFGAILLYAFLNRKD